MPRLVTAVLCDDVRQEQSGKFSLMGVFTQWNVANFGMPLPSFHVFVRLAFDEEGEHGFEVEFRAMEGQRLFVMQGAIRLETRDIGTNLYFANIDLMLNNLSVPRPGQYEFAVRVAGALVTTIPCGAIVVTPQLVQ